MMRGALALLVLAASPLAAEQPDPAPTPAPPPGEPLTRSTTLIIPPPDSRVNVWASAERVKSVEIPQWAKDEGHNGFAIYTATVGADGKLIALKLVTSSRSDAIDEAVRARAQTLKYAPALDTEGNPAQGPLNIRMSYARFDQDSPGGGIDTYTCGDLVREHDWFHAVNVDRDSPFLPKLVYLTLRTFVRLEQDEHVDLAIIEADRNAREAMWPMLLARCRKTPERLLLDEVDYPETYRRQMLRH